jgi:hypothetical protein
MDVSWTYTAEAKGEDHVEVGTPILRQSIFKRRL